MSVLRLARLAGVALAAVVMVVAGVYVVVDLARWEWNRAVISALVFLSALVVLVGMMLFAQLRRVERRLADLERHRQDADTARRALRVDDGPRAARRFRWLETPPDRLGVFVPVLLGAGVILSFVAYLVERIAGALASSTLDRRTVRHLAPDLPLGQGMFDPWSAVHDREVVSHPVGRMVAVAVVVVLAAFFVTGLRDLTSTRPREVTGPGSTMLVIEASQRGADRPTEMVADELWSSCRSTLAADVRVVELDSLGGDVVRLHLDHALGRTGRARLIGCIEDYTIPRVEGRVVELVTSAVP